MTQKDHAIRAAKILITAAAFAYLIATIPVARGVDTLSNFALPYLIAAIALVAVRELLTSISLHYLVREYAPLPFKTTFNVDAADFVANSFIPSSLGAMIAAPLLFDRYTNLSKKQGGTVRAIQLGLTAAITGSATFVGVALFYATLPSWVVFASIASGSFYFAFGALAGIWALLGDDHLIAQYLPDQIMSGPWSAAKNAAWNDTKVKTGALLLVAHVVLVGSRFFIITTGFGVSLPIHIVVLLPILAYSVSVLPISLSGIGVTETVGVVALTAFGVPVATATAIIILDRVLSAYLPLLGLYGYVSVLFNRSADLT